MPELTAANVAAHAKRIREHLRQRHIAVAQASRDRVEARQGPAPTLTIVDGRRSAGLSEVKPGGSIGFLFDPGRLIVMDAISVLRTLSPVDRHPSADDRVFRDSFVTLVDGEVSVVSAAIRPGAEITIINKRFGYSRKLERGWSLQAPNGVMEVAAAVLKAKWGKVADIRFAYIPFDGIPSPKQDRTGGRFPVIIIKARGF